MVLPEPPRPLAAYLPATRAASLLLISGQLPMMNGKLLYAGRVGADLTVEQGQQAARLCALNVLAAAKANLSSLNGVRQVLRLEGYVRSAPNFSDQAKVMNGASEVMFQVFDQAGRHSRIAVGVAELPLGAAVEVSALLEVRPL